ncbi:MAG: polysaccharide biosynthesis protein [Clostridia bacterium]|nr:polysaccharide biosynthesis protein [Clostridia bacterium]
MAQHQRKNQTLLSGALILVASTIIVKLISAIYKIPITNYIGGIGMGYYSTAYKIYLPIWSISMAGLPIAVSKMIAENMALGKYNNVKSIFKVSLRAFIVTGAGGTLLLAAVAYPYVKYVAKAPEALPVILCIAPAIFICCIMSAYRGYYEGMRNMIPTAISQITESIVKLVCGLGLTYLAIRYCADHNITQPEIRYPIEASAAIMGVTLGTLGSQIYLWIKMKKDGYGFTEEELFLAPKADSNKEILHTLIKLAIPILLTSLISNISMLIDAATVQNRLAVAVANGESIIRQMYPMIPKGTEKLNVYLYGCFDVDETLRNMVPQITLTLGVSSLPALAQYWAVNDRKNIRISIESVLRICMLISLPAGAGMAVLAQPILNLLYGTSQPDIPFMCKDILIIFGVTLCFYALSSPVTTLLQAIGKAKVPLISFGAACVIKIVLNYILVGMPQFNIKGAAYSTVACYAISVLVNLFYLFKYTKVKFNFISLLLKPVIATVFCGAAAWGSFQLLSRIESIPEKIATLAAIVAAVVAYTIMLLLLKALSKEDVLMLPAGEKIAKVLEKLRVLG